MNRPDQVVDGTLNFTESLQVNGNVDLMEDSYINSIDLSEDAVVTNKSQVIDGEYMQTILTAAAYHHFLSFSEVNQEGFLRCSYHPMT